LILSIPESSSVLYEKQSNKTTFEKTKLMTRMPQINQNSGIHIEINTFQPSTTTRTQVIKTPITPIKVQIGFEKQHLKTQNTKRVVFGNKKLSQTLNNWN
jgi:hypothetical protein